MRLVRRSPGQRRILPSLLGWSSLIASLASGCGGSGVCAGRAGVCIAVHVEGVGVSRVDQFSFVVSGVLSGGPTVTPTPPQPHDLPIDVPLLLPAGTRGMVDVDVRGLLSSTEVGRGDGSIAVDHDGAYDETIVLAGAGVDLAGSDLVGSDQSAPDLATPPAPCPAVMLILDRSASMAEKFTQTPDGGAFGSRYDGAKAAIMAAVVNHGSSLPLGLAWFSGNVCTDTAVPVQVTSGSAAAIEAAIASAPTVSNSNVGEGVDRAVHDPSMTDVRRPPSEVVLITDGSPNCNAADIGNMGQYTRSVVAAAFASGIRVHIVGLGQAMQDPAILDAIAGEGGAVCQGTTCQGHQYWPADSIDAAVAAVDSILKEIESRFLACSVNVPPNIPCASQSCSGAEICCPGSQCSAQCVGPVDMSTSD